MGIKPLPMSVLREPPSLRGEFVFRKSFTTEVQRLTVESTPNPQKAIDVLLTHAP